MRLPAPRAGTVPLSLSPVLLDLALRSCGAHGRGSKESGPSTRAGGHSPQGAGWRPARGLCGAGGGAGAPGPRLPGGPRAGEQASELESELWGLGGFLVEDSLLGLSRALFSPLMPWSDLGHSPRPRSAAPSLGARGHSLPRLATGPQSRAADTHVLHQASRPSFKVCVPHVSPSPHNPPSLPTTCPATPCRSTHRRNEK